MSYRVLKGDRFKICHQVHGVRVRKKYVFVNMTSKAKSAAV